MNPNPKETETTMVRLSRDIADQVVIIAQRRDTTVAKYLGELLRDRVLRDYKKSLQEMTHELGEAGA